MDLSANQNEITPEFETFQLQYRVKSQTWNIVTKAGNYWAVGAASAIQASSKEDKSGDHFKLKWNEDGTCSIFIANPSRAEEENLKAICNRKSGQLYCGSSNPVCFYVMFQNRTFLNLRANNGSSFVGLKSSGGGKLESNKTSPDSVLVEYINSESNRLDLNFNCCHLKMTSNFKYLTIIEANMVACDASSRESAQQWIIELRTENCIAIRTFETGLYLNLTNQGSIVVNNCHPKDATLWEF